MVRRAVVAVVVAAGSGSSGGGGVVAAVAALLSSVNAPAPCQWDAAGLTRPIDFSQWELVAGSDENWLHVIHGYFSPNIKQLCSVPSTPFLGILRNPSAGSLCRFFRFLKLYRVAVVAGGGVAAVAGGVMWCTVSWGCPWSVTVLTVRNGSVRGRKKSKTSTDLFIYVMCVVWMCWFFRCCN